MSESKLGKISFNHYSVQKLLREQGFLALLPRFLNKISPEMITIGEATVDHFRLSGLGAIMADNTEHNENIAKKVEQILESMVRIIFRIIRNATKCNLVSSNYLLTHLSHTIMFLGHHCGAEEFYISLFKNNPKLLDREDLFLPDIKAQYTYMQNKTNRFFPEAFKLLNVFTHRDQ